MINFKQDERTLMTIHILAPSDNLTFTSHKMEDEDIHDYEVDFMVLTESNRKQVLSRMCKEDDEAANG